MTQGLSRFDEHNCSIKMNERRRYQLKHRAEQMEDTARRIAEAAFGLHATIGPSNTTISAIAQKAGVQRLTVYRHYPDDLSLFRACVEHGLATLPLPDPAHWDDIKDPVERLSSGLSEMYAYYRRTEQVWTNILPDLPKIPALYQANEPTFERFGRIHASLSSGWALRARRMKLVSAAIWLAMQFPTWQALVRQQGLSDSEAVEVMVASVLGLKKATVSVT
jgi:AcrR family transcriptional regulator